MARTEELRAFYADFVTANVGIYPDSKSKLRSAFTSTPREHFTGSGPWSIYTLAGYIRTPSDDLAFLYQDTTVALVSESGINNGQPTLHAFCISALNVKEGECVVHIGAGTGYYTAILAELVGQDGLVSAYEIDGNLAKRATENLAECRNVKVTHGSGSVGMLPVCDAIYVNAGATDPLDNWLDALRLGGRLLFPLTSAQNAGGMLLVTRKASDAFDARFVMQARFVPCAGARDEQTGHDLTTAFARGDARLVKSLRRNTQPDNSCWVSGRTWWLSKLSI